MRFHILSDIHLETGPYRLPGNLDYDVVIAAGDSAEGIAGIEFLKTLGKPVIFVPGNHEYYSEHGAVDMVDRLAELRAAAQDSNVRVLDNEATVIGDVRFLGATLWTNYGDRHADLLRDAAMLKDYQQIGAEQWYEQREHVDYFLQHGADIWDSDQLSQDIALRAFHPLIALWLHEQSMVWLNTQLDEEFDGDTVIVTHHHPSFQSLRLSGVDQRILGDRSRWHRRGARDVPIRHKIATYASDLDAMLQRHQKHIALWVAGHIHTHLDYMHCGVRIVCNPRGRAITADNDNAPHAQDNPFVGTGKAFDPRFVVALEDGLTLNVTQEVSQVEPLLTELHNEARQFADYVGQGDQIIQCAIREAIELRARRFEEQFTGLVNRIAGNLLTEKSFSEQWYCQLEHLGLPVPNGNLALKDAWFSSTNLAEEVAALLRTQADCIRLLPRFAVAPGTRQNIAQQRLLAAMGAIAADGVEAQLQAMPYLNRPWRQVHSHLGRLLLRDGSRDSKYHVASLVDRLLNPDMPKRLREFDVWVSGPDEETA